MSKLHQRYIATAQLTCVFSQPKTYLVPERQRTKPPPRSPFGWLLSIFKYKDKEIINKCGLDAYFFLRYLQTLLVIFVPLACILIPVLLPLNYVQGRGKGDILQAGDSASDIPAGLDTLAWGNVSPFKTSRYWAHLILAILVIIWVCYVFFAELRVYIRVRQDYLTSAEHRLRASATTVLVSAIPDKWLTIEALSGLYDVFPGGIRNIWINRDYGPLLEKVRVRQDVVSMLESAETQLIRDCKRADNKVKKQMAKDYKSTKEEKAQQAAIDDAKAAKVAQGEGVTAGDIHQVHHTVEEAVVEEDIKSLRPGSSIRPPSMRLNTPEEVRVLKKVPVVGGGLAVVGGFIGKNIRGAAAAVDKFGDDIEHKIEGTADTVLEKTVETQNGFNAIEDDRRSALHVNTAERKPLPPAPIRDEPVRTRSDMSGALAQRNPGESKNLNVPAADVNFGNSVETPKGFGEHRNITDMSLGKIPYTFGGDGTIETTDMRNNWWKFWNGPDGGFATPQPYGYEQTEAEKQNFGQLVGKTGQGVWGAIKSVYTSDPGPEHEYPPHINPDFKEEEGALWERYIKKTQRPTHRLPKWGMPFLPYIFPWVCEKVDTIYWCREELARLNVEIEYDQDHPEDYPRMNSAFIQFNHQVAAHMAAQAVNHHIPRHMAPRLVEVSPTDVIWDNMSMKWWETWVRSGVIMAIVFGMCILWAIPVSATTLLGNIPALIDEYKWLKFLAPAEDAIKPIAGVIPPLVLALLMLLPPVIFYKFAHMQGNPTGKLVELSVQNYYFSFLFVQVFLVVSVASGALAALGDTFKNPAEIPTILAKNLPKASNYFFSYMIIQALSVSAGNLLQVGSLLGWLIMPKLMDNTARQKWARNTALPHVQWGRYFPTYTNFACIALIYSTVAPLITIFAIITFTSLWVANRYSMLYVYKHTEDTGGLLYPRAINQTFTGLYVMELCLVGLFFLVRDETNTATCVPQAIIMIICIVFTALFQLLLNQAFSPLFEHLPITLEDDAVLRDEAFARAQAAKWNSRDTSDNEEDPHTLHSPNDPHSATSHDSQIEMRNLRRDSTMQSDEKKGVYGKFDPRRGGQKAGSWAIKGGKNLGQATFGDPSKLRHNQKKKGKKDIEAQKLMGEALFGGYNDEIEDLTPEERDTLVRAAFQHEALRARRPNVWLPRDDLGVSDEEVRRTELFGMGNIWITNRGTALDRKARVMYGKNPPDFSEVDLIVL